MTEFLSIFVERAACIRDACMYCVGNCPQYVRRVQGPNAAANWVHEREDGGGSAFCAASTIYSRHRFYHGTVDDLIAEVLRTRG